MAQPRSLLLSCAARPEAGSGGGAPVAALVVVGTDEVNDRGAVGGRLGFVALQCRHIRRSEAVTAVDNVEVNGLGRLLGIVLSPPGALLPPLGSVVASAPARPPDPGRRVSRRVWRGR